MEYHIKPSQALERLRASASEQSAQLLELGSLTVRFYAPHLTDKQKPHTRDEVYVIVNGSATFRCCGRDVAVDQGDVLTVPAGQEHVFVDFTPGFAAWIFFYGPEGGERTSGKCGSEELFEVTTIEAPRLQPAENQASPRSQEG